MNIISNNILQFCYKRELQGLQKHELIFSNFQNDNSALSRHDVRSAINYLESEGIIGVITIAIGMAVVRLTEYGLAFCNKSH